jgi:hypothetical protein
MLLLLRTEHRKPEEVTGRVPLDVQMTAEPRYNKARVSDLATIQRN